MKSFEILKSLRDNLSVEFPELDITTMWFSDDFRGAKLMCRWYELLLI